MSRYENPYFIQKKKQPKNDYVIDLKRNKDNTERKMPDSRTPIKALEPMQLNINLMASPGTDAFLRETIPRQMAPEPMDSPSLLMNSPTLELVEPGV